MPAIGPPSLFGSPLNEAFVQSRRPAHQLRVRRSAGASCTRPIASVMTREIVSCRPGDILRQVWTVMKARGLKHVPVVDADGRALGILSARAVMQALVEKTEQEEELLRDIVMCLGYP